MSRTKAIYDLLQKVGELMIRVDGQDMELHLHNVKYDRKLDALVVDGATETYWIFGDSIQYAWIHREVKD